MNNMPTLSTRSQQALDVLADGGRFVHRLERNSYTGRAQYAYRLLRKDHAVVKGMGIATFNELRDAGFLMRDAGGTSVSTYYKLDTVG